LLRDHRGRLADWIRQPQASGRTLDDKITRYEILMERWTATSSTSTACRCSGRSTARWA